MNTDPKFLKKLANSIRNKEVDIVYSNTKKESFDTTLKKIAAVRVSIINNALKNYFN